MTTVVSSNDQPKVVFCNAGDTKPTDVPNGSVLFEMDHSNSKVTFYCFDADNTAWVPFGS